jgi:tRNA nucleotidyltransferase (CCA-adding enzyme)
LINEADELLRQVSGQRLRHEIDLMLGESRAPEMLARLAELELLEAIHPALSWASDTAAALRAVLFDPIDITWDLPGEFGHTPLRRALAYLVWFMHFTPDEILSITARLAIPANLRQAILLAEKLWDDLPGMLHATPGEVVHRLESVPLAALYAILQQDPAPEAKITIQRYIHEWQHVHPVIDGRKLQDLGVKPGPVYKDILESLRKARLNGEISTEAEELALVDQWLSGWQDADYADEVDEV